MFNYKPFPKQVEFFEKREDKIVLWNGFHSFEVERTKMANLEVRVRIKCNRDISKGEILEPYPEEVYTKPGYSSTACLMVEATIHPETLSVNIPKKESD